MAVIGVLASGFFGIPIGILGAGFEDWVGENAADEADDDRDGAIDDDEDSQPSTDACLAQLQAFISAKTRAGISSSRTVPRY